MNKKDRSPWSRIGWDMVQNEEIISDQTQTQETIEQRRVNCLIDIGASDINTVSLLSAKKSLHITLFTGCEINFSKN